MPRTTTLPKPEILAAYEAGATVRQLADRYERSFATMRENLHRWGATVRRTGPERTHSLNEGYFDRIDSEHKAYWLGFAIADGSVVGSKTGNWAFRVELASYDAGHLELLAHDLCSSAPIVVDTKRSAARIIFCSRQLCDGLMQHECYPNKTAAHGTPRLREDLYHHFYRGVTDGDGSFTCSRDSWRYELVGSSTFILDYQQWLMKHVGVSETKTVQKGRVLSVRYTGTRQVKEICRILYSDATIALERKLAAYERLLAS